ncbi:uncharacterized protein ASCRUDRAFT_76162 [Ascoidea rubescens DSM 1968]|uniref:Uncharacterized protein n=1 Tax=Ascoidea rubescens DSM 1968 TaxID=1344418 RepID=A0A1D2VGS3_9ASCO|nr:hypothetical protein ASCRUDRAFT_76162 [Ascoidea rubescens DSM 1968]ODV60799.1 hypothetical protein ASCRUDRAFT_76162 [Ascoidea rubescens DSM 1968]
MQKFHTSNDDHKTPKIYLKLKNDKQKSLVCSFKSYLQHIGFTLKLFKYKKRLSNAKS